MIGKCIQYGDKERPIVGVMKDYHHKSLSHAIEPMIFKNEMGGCIYFSTKFGVNNEAEVGDLVANIQTAWKRIYLANPFNFFVLVRKFFRYNNHSSAFTPAGPPKKQ